MAFLTEAANRGSIATGYEIENSCKFEDDNDEWLYRTNASGTNTKTWTLSWWFKQTKLATQLGHATEHWRGGAYGEGTRAGIFADDRIWIDIGGGDGNTGTLFRSLSTQKIRDTSAWYHIVIACDSTQSTEADRLKVWLNGVEVTAWDQKQYPTLNFGSALAGFGGIQMNWGSGDATYHGYSGYLAECNYVDGVTATQNDFGEFDEDSGIWKPKEYTGSYGTNGSYLDFESASDLGANAKGNDVNFSLNNITAADQATDTPTNNFCTINTIEYTGGYNITNGGTQAERNANTAWYSTTSSMGVSKGKWYWEAQFASGATSFMAGVSIDSYISTQANPFDGQYLGSGSGDGGFGYNNSGTVFYNNTLTSGYGSAPSTNIIGLAIDMDNEKAYVSINGTWQNSGDPTSGATGTGAIDLFLDSNGDTAFFSLCAYNPNYTHKINFGGYTTQSQVQQVMPMATELLNMHPHQATTHCVVKI
jgi:hypothetical protein